MALAFDTLTTARSAIAARKISAVELTRQSLDQIEKTEPTVQAFITVLNERAMERARAVDAGQITGPLAGVPIAIKDNLCTSFARTTCASKMLCNFRSPYDATVVQRLEAAGAIIVGKTNMDEFAMGSSTENSAMHPTRNPWDTTRVPGGSSGGSAAAVAAGMCCAAVGSDTGGSIRQPAALCGLVGLKPTFGRVSRYGLVAFASSLDQVGPMAWTVTDAACLLGVMAGRDARDATSSPVGVDDYLAELDQPLKGVRMGIVREYSQMPGMDAQVGDAMEAAIAAYVRLGVTLVEVSLPHTRYGIAAYYVIAPSEASSNLARYDGVHFGHRTAEPAHDIMELSSQSRAEGFGPEVQRRIMIGTYALSAGYHDKYYVRAQQTRALIKRDFEQAFTQCDAIITPTSPTPAFVLGQKSDDPMHMYLVDVFTVSCNIAGIAGVSVPCGFTRGEKPLPIGLQLLGNGFSEARLLRIARMYEKATGWHQRRPIV